MAEEVKLAMGGEGSDDFALFSNRIAWQRFLRQARQVRAWAEPARLYAQDDGTIRMEVPVEILNLKPEPVSGTLRWETLVSPWRTKQETVKFGPVQPFQRTRVLMTAEGPGVGGDPAGHTRCLISMQPAGGKTVAVPVTISAVAVMPLARPVRIDGDLTDWPAGRANQISDFTLLGWTPSPEGGDPLEGRQTHAFVASDGKMLYVAARMQDDVSQMRVDQRNTVAYDGGLPVGEDLVEILIDPDNGRSGGPEKLVHVIVKANGAAVANVGVDMWPPVCNPRPLGSRVVAATRLYRNAWTAEVAIPLSAIKGVRTKAAYWGLGICRLRASSLEYSTWAASRGSCYHPSALGNLLMTR